MAGDTVILVCGGRDYKERDKVYSVLDAVLKKYPDMVLVHGAEPNGADTIAEDWAKHRQVRYRGYPAQWNKLGRSAGPKRNKQMCDLEKPFAGIAFPGGAGTKGMVALLKEAGIPVMEV